MARDILYAAAIQRWEHEAGPYSRRTHEWMYADTIRATTPQDAARQLDARISRQANNRGPIYRRFEIAPIDHKAIPLPESPLAPEWRGVSEEGAEWANEKTGAANT